jgi:hypothetical protein
MKLFQGIVKTQVLFNLKDLEKNQKKIKLMRQKKLNRIIKFKNMNKISEILWRNFQACKIIQVKF